MERFELEVFEKTSDYVQCRLTRAGGGEVVTRGLDRAALEELIAGVERAYTEDTVAHRVFGSSQLRDLGRELFAFLDGDQRWAARVVADPDGATLRISAGQRLRHLPWELLADDGGYLAVADRAPLLVTRAPSQTSRPGVEVAVRNRPLRVLFMATSPEGVEPVLSYEAEEAGILAATADTGTELVVEESGTLDGLGFTADSYGGGYFDVLHLSGHTTVENKQPVFLVENEFGGRATATAQEIARAMAGKWPRVVFVSGCLTSNAPDFFFFFFFFF